MTNIVPKIAETYRDFEGRELYISNVDVNNNLGREIQGSLIKKGIGKDYSCTLKMWEEIWRDKVSPIPLSQNKIG